MSILYSYFDTHENMRQCKRVAESRCHQELRKELLLVNMRLSNNLYIVRDSKDRSRMGQLQLSGRFLEPKKIKTVQGKLT